ncbi:MAG: DNA topoisomerase IV subunit A, partial [Betaproteobacteria bacterium]|nr:DNA topoisomerase IV subunit A [Betaproteobacteria bacterium]
RARTGHGIDVTQLSFKDGDALGQTLECKTVDAVTGLASSGKTFSISAADIPSGRGDGTPVNTLVNSGSDAIVWIGTGDPAQRLLMNSTGGLGFLCRLGDLASKTRQGKDFFAVSEGAQARAPAKVGEGKYVAALSSDSRLLLFEIEELPERPNGGVGVQLLALPDDITLADVAVTDGRSLILSGIKRKNRAAETLEQKSLAEHIGKRAQRGRLADVSFRPDKLGE